MLTTTKKSEKNVNGNVKEGMRTKIERNIMNYRFF